MIVCPICHRAVDMLYRVCFDDVWSTCCRMCVNDLTVENNLRRPA